MIAGHGTIGAEMHQDLPDLESVFIPVGGGALLSGVASVLKTLKPSVKVFAVQAEVNPPLSTAFAAGGATWIDWHETIVEGASTPIITDEMYPILRRLVDEVVLVSEDEVMGAMRRRRCSRGCGGIGDTGCAERTERLRRQWRKRRSRPVRGSRVRGTPIASSVALLRCAGVDRHSPWACCSWPLPAPEVGIRSCPPSPARLRLLRPRPYPSTWPIFRDGS